MYLLGCPTLFVRELALLAQRKRVLLFDSPSTAFVRFSINHSKHLILSVCSCAKDPLLKSVQIEKNALCKYTYFFNCFRMVTNCRSNMNDTQSPLVCIVWRSHVVRKTISGNHFLTILLRFGRLIWSDYRTLIAIKPCNRGHHSDIATLPIHEFICVVWYTTDHRVAT